MKIKKLLIEWSDLSATGVVFVKTTHEIKQSISDILIITIYSILLHKFPRKSRSPEVRTPTLWKPLPEVEKSNFISAKNEYILVFRF
jgi:hypothetical protein